MRNPSVVPQTLFRWVSQFRHEGKPVEAGRTQTGTGPANRELLRCGWKVPGQLGYKAFYGTI
jgi:transposase-like protein